MAPTPSNQSQPSSEEIATSNNTQDSTKQTILHVDLNLSGSFKPSSEEIPHETSSDLPNKGHCEPKSTGKTFGGSFSGYH
jgi:hypothetical protein